MTSNSEPTRPVAGAIKERAQLYLAVYRELSERYGDAEAQDVLSTVSGRLGATVGRRLSHLGPRDFPGLLEAFFKAPDDGATFRPKVTRLDDQGLDVTMMVCPLKDAWREAGCDDREVCTLLRCASAYDRAVIDAAGFALDLELWSPGREGCCRSKVSARA